MKEIGKVIDIFSAKKGQSGLPRPKVNSLDLISGFGIRNDKFAGQDENRSVMIVGIDSYNLAKKHDINLEFGSLGENILLDFDPHKYEIGTIFQIGNTKIQTTQNCTICNHLSVFHKRLPIIVKKCRGIYCKIIKNGRIEEGSLVKVIETT